MAIHLPLASRGGQYAVHTPQHSLWPFLSFSNRYSVRPLPSTRIRPNSLGAVATVAPRVGGLLAANAAPAPTSKRAMTAAAITNLEAFIWTPQRCFTF